MSTKTVNIAWTGTTFATWLATMQAFTNALTQLGVAQTTDTGQVSWASLSAFPSAITTAQTANTNGEWWVGYEIRELVAPGLPTIYLRFDYGVSINTSGTTPGGAAGSRPLIKMRSATATDGAGNLAGTVNNAGCQTVSALGSSFNSNVYFPSSYFYPSTSILRPLNIASDGANFLTIIIDPTNQGGDNGMGIGPGAWGIERTITAGDGTYNNVGWITVDVGGNGQYTVSGQNGNMGYSVLSAQNGFVAHINNAIPTQTPSTMYSSSGTGNACSIFPLTVMTPLPQGPATMMVSYFTTDIVTGLQFQATMYGSLRNYMALGKNMVNANICNPANSATYSPALRFD